MTTTSTIQWAVRRSRPADGGPWWRAAVRGCAALAVVSLVLQFGFDSPPVPMGVLTLAQLLTVAVYAASRVRAIRHASNKWAAVRACWVDFVLLAAAGAVLLLWVELPHGPVLTASALYVALIQGLLIGRLFVEAVRWNLAVSRSGLNPTRLIAMTFVVLIVAGGSLLSLPKATAPALRAQPDFSLPRHVVNCMFTATSAACVTGLSMYDTGSDFTRFGQLVILLLIQLGGLGIMIFGSVFGLLAGRQLSLRQSLVLQDATSHRTLGHMRALVVFIVVFTFLAEAVGAVILYPMWAHGSSGVGERWFLSVFHAVSAFCNAGFSLQSDSLVSYSRSWQVYGCIAPLIVLGGLGFPVLSDLWHGGVGVWHRGVDRLRGRSRHVGSTIGLLPQGWGSTGSAGDDARSRHRFALHSKIVLTVTALMIVLPAVAFYVFESLDRGAVVNGTAGFSTMRDASWFGRVLDALFLSITCRTAGFNTCAMDSASVSPSTQVLSGLLMFVGGGPASTAGGVKIVPVAILILGVWATLRGRDRIEAFGRTIPDYLLRRSAVVITVMVALVFAMTLVLTFTESAAPRECLFEVVSACGTVGLSTGLTPDLSVVGRLIVMVGMVAGRIGPLTLLIALAGKAATTRYEYATEHVTIG